MVGADFELPGFQRRAGIDLLNVAAVAGAALALGLGARGMAGWLFDVEALRRFAPAYVSMNPVTAVCLMLCAAAMALSALSRKRLAGAVAGVVAAAGAAKLIGLLGGGLPIDQLLFADRLSGDFGGDPNRMAPNTAAALVMAGVALVLLQTPWRHARMLAQLFAMWMSLLAAVALVGYGADLVTLRKLGSYLPMALPTALALLAIGLGIIALIHDVGLIPILRGEGPAGTMCRIMLPLVIVVPMIAGTLRLWGEEQGYYSRQAAIALQMNSSVIVATTLLMVCVLALQRSDLARRARERELRNSEQFNRLVASANPDCISLLDDDAVVLFANDALVRAHGLTDDSRLVGHPYGYRLDAAGQAECAGALASAREGGVGRYTLCFPDPDGEARWFDTIVSKLPPDHDWPFRYLSISRDITEKREIEDQVRWKAAHDDLTHLPNRAQFQTHLERAVRLAGQDGFALLVLDIDNFKMVNDTLGHDAGDCLLKTVAERVGGAVRQGDVLARLAGDEFAVIARGVRTESGAAMIAERIFQSLREPWLYQGRLGECRLSIGASLAPRHGDTSEGLLKHADIALYEAKSRGKGQIAVFRPSMKAAVERRNRQIELARHALSRNVIVPYYQPKIELGFGRVAGFEALLRWRHPTQGVQMPHTIQAAFEDLELAGEITQRMLGQVLLDMRRWLDRGVDFGHVAINVTAADLRQEDFAVRLLANLDAHALPHECLQVEITETVFLGRGAEYVERALRLLHDAGIRVALDDFGTGYASLSHLKQFPVDIVKIDRSFLHDFAVDPQNQAIINTVISLGHSLDIAIVAEGIETVEQQRHLLARGCTYGQGYLYGKAVPAQRVPRTVLAGPRELRKAA
jgi:diguanylate cyclase (GGDEF)-like protein/PAS domain S-box-containing protein